jgi:hypothetical protein
MDTIARLITRVSSSFSSTSRASSSDDNDATDAFTGLFLDNSLLTDEVVAELRTTFEAYRKIDNVNATLRMSSDNIHLPGFSHAVEESLKAQMFCKWLRAANITGVSTKEIEETEKTAKMLLTRLMETHRVGGGSAEDFEQIMANARQEATYS